MIRLVDLQARHARCAEPIEHAVLEVLRSGTWIGGPVLSELEPQIAQLMGRNHAVGVANGTDALELCMRSLGIGEGDEVIVPAVSFFATAGAVCRVGARPVLVDVRPDRPLLDWDQVERARSTSTRAVIPVHLFGMDAGRSDTDLTVIDDLAQAVGATPSLGAGRLGAVSFYPTKVISGAGDGGMVLCQDAEQAAAVRALGSHGCVDGLHQRIRGSVGGNSRMDAIHAAIVLAQLPGLSSRIQRRQAIYRAYRAALGDSVLEHEPGSPVSILCMRHDHRDAMLSHLKSRGIGAGCYYPHPLSRQPALSHARVVGDLPNAETFCAEALALPCHADLGDSDVEQVIAAFESCP